MKRALVLCALLASTAAAAPPAHFTTQPVHRPPRVIVRFRDNADAAHVRPAGAVASAFAAPSGPALSPKREAFRQFMRHMATVDVPAGQDAAAFARTLMSDPNVLYAEPDATAKAFVIPDDANFDRQWGLHNTGQTIAGFAGTPGADVHAPEAWDITTGAPSVIVAIVDSGIDYTHPDLSDNMWRNSAEEFGDPGVDDDGDGYVDDIYGYDFKNLDGDPMDDYYHGTHIAGIIGAVTNNAMGVAGVNWNVRLMSLKFLDSSGNGSVSDAIAAMQYAIMKGADVINNSWGTSTASQALQDVVQQAHDAGIVVVAAAGNDGNSTVYYPAGYNTVIAVAATTNKDVPWPSSNFGPQVDVAAPGQDIWSTDWNTVQTHGYAYHSGTSMAAPFVSGEAALIKAADPLLSPDQIKTMIETNVDVPAGWDTRYGKGRINILKALQNQPDSTPPDLSINTPTNLQIVSGFVLISATATDNVGVDHLTFTIDGGNPIVDSTPPYQYNWDTTGVSDTTHNIVVNAYDAAGNQATRSVSVRVRNDAVPPNVAITQPADQSTVAGFVTVEATATDNTSIQWVQFFVDDVLSATDTTAPYSFTWNSAAAGAGPHTIRAEAKDPSGNIADSTVTVNVVIDNTPPGVGINQPPDGSKVEGTVVVVATATDNIGVAAIRFYVDNVLAATDNTSPYSFSWNAQAAGLGTHVIRAEAHDVADNVASATSTVTVVPDDVPPSVSITTPTDGANVEPTFSVAANAQDNVGVTKVDFLIDNTLLVSDTNSPYGGQVTTALDLGTHTVSAVAWDAAGHSTRQDITVTVPPDTIPPGVSIVSPKDGSTVSGSVLITVHAQDDRAMDRVFFFVDGNSIGSDSGLPNDPNTFAIPWASDGAIPGSHKIRVEAADKTGNRAAAEITLNIAGPSSALAELPNSFFPNRNETVSIGFALAQPTHVTATIYNLRGVKITELAQDLPAGSLETLTWDGKNSDREIVAAGVYLVLMDIGGEKHTAKVVLRK